MRLLLLLGSIFYVTAVFSQAYPSKPIRFIVSFPPGGSADLVARAIAPGLGERLGQPVVVENRPGGGGDIGVDAVAKSAPDGHTIGLGAAGALSLNALLYPSMPFNAEKDLAPISLLAMIPFVLIANPSLPLANLNELISFAKTKPGTLAYGHGGNASAMHLSGELLKMMAGIDLLAVPYKGSGPVAADVLGGQVPLGIVDLPSAIANIRTGKLKALAVTTARRAAALPEVPTFAEAGVPGYESIGWFGAIAPANTSSEKINILNRGIVAALSVPAIRSRALAAGAEPATSTPQEFADFMRAETRKWREVIRTAKIKAD
jgi:tripartite-type tricarboxylate transporter receptor subunit TctC